MKRLRNTLIGTILAGVLASVGCSNEDASNTNPNNTIEPEVPVVSDSTRLELTESLFEHYGTLTKEHEPHLLQDSTLTSHNLDDTETIVTGAQTLDFGSLTPRFAKDNLGNLDVFLHSKHSERLYTWKLGFDEGVQSRFNSDGKLVDIIQQDINICGKNYRITDAEVAFLGADVDEVSLDLMTSKAGMPLDVGYQVNVNVDGVYYDVEVLGTVLNADGSYAAQLRINGQTTADINVGDIFQLANGQFVGIYWTDNDTVEFGLGAQKLTLTDNNINDDDYAGAVSGDGIFGYHSTGRDAKARIRGSVSVDQLVTLNQLAYQLFANMQSETDIYVDTGHGLDEFLDQPGASVINVGFNGLKTKRDDGSGNQVNRQYSSIDLTYSEVPDTKSGYMLSFTNKFGTAINIEIFKNEGNGIEQTLVAKEAASETDYNISTADKFVVTRDGITHVLQYEAWDNTQGAETLTFSYPAGGTQGCSYDPATGAANLVVGGNTFAIKVDTATGNIAIDQNGDGSFDGADVPIMDKYGASITLESVSNQLARAYIRTAADKIDGMSVDEVIALDFDIAGKGMGLLWSSPRWYDTVPGALKAQSRYGVSLDKSVSGDLSMAYPEVQEEPWALLVEKGN